MINTKIYLILILTTILTACFNYDDAYVAEHNLTKAADNFEIMRRVIMYNAIIGQNVMVTEGRCSITNNQFRTSIICKISPDKFIRNFYGKSDNISYFVEQMAPVPASVYHYRRVSKPQIILPDIDFRGDMSALASALSPDSSD